MGRSAARAAVAVAMPHFESVCPFHQSGVPHLATWDRKGDRRRLLAAAESFSGTLGQSPSHALIVLGPTCSGYRRTRAWAVDVFLDLFELFLVLSGAPRPTARQQVREVRRQLNDNADPLRPMLGCGNHMLHAICMAPVYPVGHPRWAPRPMVVVTWERDVQAAQSLAVLARIRERMREGHGALYDADDLMVPLPRAER